MISQHRSGVIGQVHRQAMSSCLDQRLNLFNRRGDDAPQIERFLIKDNKPSRDAGHIEKVIDQAGHMIDLL